MRKKKGFPLKYLTQLQKLEACYGFKNPLSYYFMGVGGKPEEQEQKAFMNCICTEFPQKIGHEIEIVTRIDKCTREKREEPIDVYRAIIVATADFYDKYGKAMATYRHMGYQPGTPDIMILVKNAQFHGLIIEMKSAKGRATDGQKRTLDFFSQQGFSCHICQGFPDALSVFLHYFSLETHGDSK